MKIFFILLPLLFSISFYAQDAELLKKIGARKDKDGNILLGKAFIRKDDRSISFPGRINVREGVIEVLVSTPRGRMHESLIVTELDPFQLQMALVLAGYDNGDITRGAPFHIEIIYGKSRRINVDEWLYDNTAGKPKEKGTYVFVGSSFKDKQCLASLEGNLININVWTRHHSECRSEPKISIARIHCAEREDAGSRAEKQGIASGGL